MIRFLFLITLIFCSIGMAEESFPEMPTGDGPSFPVGPWGTDPSALLSPLPPSPPIPRGEAYLACMSQRCDGKEGEARTKCSNKKCPGLEDMISAYSPSGPVFADDMIPADVFHAILNAPE